MANLTRHTLLIAALLAIVSPYESSAQDKVSFGTDWRAQAEHGGFYQAQATGIYQRYNLEVDIRQGGPQVNHSLLLAAGRLDFNMAPDSFAPLNFVREQVPAIAVAAMFQKDPKVLVAHPGVGNDSLSQLKGKPIMIGSDTRAGVWLFLKSKFGFTDDQVRPYSFNIAPFLVDRNAIQQGYLSSEPYLIEQQGIKPVVHLFADYGYSSYAAIVQTTNRLADGNPDLVQRFVNASIEGWYSYLYGDPSPGNALIKRQNQDMTDALLAYGRDKLKTHGIVDSGDSQMRGIGAMSDDRWQAFFTVMAEQGLYPRNLDWRKAYTLRFVNKAHGLALRR